MIAAAEEVEIIKTPERFQAVSSDWDALWRRAKGEHHESYATCWLIWEHLAQRDGQALRIITVRRHGLLVAVCPLIRKWSRLCYTLRPLGQGAADYMALLLDPDHAADDLARAIWRAMLKRCASDIIVLPYVAHTNPLYRLAMTHPGLVAATEHPRAVARLSLESDWDSYTASVGKLLGKTPGTLMKRLKRQGDVDLRILGPRDVEENARMIDWMLASKRDWAERSNKRGEWLYSTIFRDYLVALTNRTGASEGEASARIMVLTLDGAIVAANLIGLGKDSALGLMNGFDQRMAKFSPGGVVTEAWIRWAVDHKCDFDLGVGTEPFKPYWSKGNIQAVSNIRIARSAWGRARRPCSKALASMLRWARVANPKGATAPTSSASEA
jgi:CelD/BcsL family acetyltransferase involved in cellulose biosynthesis